MEHLYLSHLIKDSLKFLFQRLPNKLLIRGSKILAQEIFKILKTVGNFEILKIYNWKIILDDEESDNDYEEEKDNDTSNSVLNIKELQFGSNELKQKDQNSEASEEEKECFFNHLRSIIGEEIKLILTLK